MTMLKFIVCCGFLIPAHARPAAPVSGQTVRAVGVIQAIDPATRRITIKTDGVGPEMNIIFEQATSFRRVAPGATDLESATTISASDLAVGDRILARGRSAGDSGKSEDPSRATVITLLAGVEPLLRSSSKGGRALDLGSWNLDLNMNVGLP